MLGPRNKREARLRRRSRPRIAAGPADSRVFASLRRSAAAVFQHTCGVQGDTAAPFAIQQVLFRTGKGGAAMGIVYQEGPSLARDLGLPLRTLYAVSNRIPAHYHRAEVPKRDGGVRVLRVPDPVLKDIQRRIARVLLSGMPVSPHATAYRYGAGVVENARRHVGRPELLKLDILHFFDSIRYIQVKEAAFPAEIYAEPLRILLSMLCYDRDVLPQGAPTSPWIANLVLRPLTRGWGPGAGPGGWCIPATVTTSPSPGRRWTAWRSGRRRACGACWGRWTFGSRPSRTARRRRSTAVGCWPRCGMGVKRGGHMGNGVLLTAAM